MPEAVTLTTNPVRKYNLVQVFVVNKAQLEEYLPQAIGALKQDSLLWIAYPKKSSKIATDLSRDSGWEALEKASLRPVLLVSIDDTWSAFRCKRTEFSSSETLVAAQYDGQKAALKPIYEHLTRTALGFGADADLTPRKSYRGLTRGKIFAVIKPSTRTRVDLGLKLPDARASDRLVEAPGFGSGSITHKVALADVSEIDEELVSWLRKAYDLAA